jgi:agmatine deiminase
MKGTAADREQTPAGCGFFMPAEWEAQSGVWLSWPHDEETFPDLEGVKETYADIICAVCEHEHVHLLVRDTDDLKEAKNLIARRTCPSPHNLVPHEVDYADVWIRDYGPSFIVNRERAEIAMVDWTFNAWGNKYPALLGDDLVPSIINEELRLTRFCPGIVLEGGSIDVNGRGMVMTTEQCLFHKNRNPDLSRTDLEEILCHYLGVLKVIWLKEGIAGDDTDGHIDDVARFVGERTVICAFEEDPEDENHLPLRENFRILSQETDLSGRPLNVIPLPLPGRVGDDRRLPASYANFLVTNRAVLFPVFNHPNDRKAKAVLESVFPGREPVGIDCRALVQGLGAIHCISQQQPLP